MPPQQRQGLADLLGNGLHFGAHRLLRFQTFEGRDLYVAPGFRLKLKSIEAPAAVFAVGAGRSVGITAVFGATHAGAVAVAALRKA